VSVAENLKAVRQRIEAAGRNPDEIAIVAVTKSFGPEVCKEAISAGLKVLGENRVQEALAKMDAVDGAQWHLIGHLQTNKVKQIAGRFALIQSIDSVRIAEAVAAIDSAQPVLVEVNVAKESQKTGVEPEAASELIAKVGEMLDLQGLMAIGPAEGDPTPAFERLRAMRDEAQQRLGRALPILSIGMSGDFEAAVKAGSTMLRLGCVRTARLMFIVAQVLISSLVFIVVMLIRVVFLDRLNQPNPHATAYQITEPVLAPIRRMLPRCQAWTSRRWSSCWAPIC
jgi:pyridoxal phosphate enzyme (YggS family)